MKPPLHNPTFTTLKRVVQTFNSTIVVLVGGRGGFGFLRQFRGTIRDVTSCVVPSELRDGVRCAGAFVGLRRIRIRSRTRRFQVLPGRFDEDTGRDELRRRETLIDAYDIEQLPVRRVRAPHSAVNVNVKRALTFFCFDQPTRQLTSFPAGWVADSTCTYSSSGPGPRRPAGPGFCCFCPPGCGCAGAAWSARLAA